MARLLMLVSRDFSNNYCSHARIGQTVSPILGFVETAVLVI